jgi:hypothetical protein
MNPDSNIQLPRSSFERIRTYWDDVTSLESINSVSTATHALLQRFGYVERKTMWMEVEHGATAVRLREFLSRKLQPLYTWTPLCPFPSWYLEMMRSDVIPSNVETDWLE